MELSMKCDDIKHDPTNLRPVITRMLDKSNHTPVHCQVEPLTAEVDEALRKWSDKGGAMMAIRDSAKGNVPKEDKGDKKKKGGKKKK